MSRAAGWQALLLVDSNKTGMKCLLSFHLLCEWERLVREGCERKVLFLWMAVFSTWFLGSIMVSILKHWRGARERLLSIKTREDTCE